MHSREAHSSMFTTSTGKGFGCLHYMLVFGGYLPSCRILDSESRNCCSPRTPDSSASFLQLGHSARSPLSSMYFVL